jgi:2-iminoacetate synthase
MQLESLSAEIYNVLERTKNASRGAILDILCKAKEKKGLALDEAGRLLDITDPGLIQELFNTAGWIKNEIYGERLVFFAPLYVSDFCVNNCRYCNFRCGNTGLARRRLGLCEIEEQVKVLINMGHKRILLEAGEDPRNNSIDYIVQAIERIYATNTEKGNIRRINVNIAATTVENYRKLKAANIGTYQLFQETYHRPTYERLHSGPKQDYLRQISAHIRAFEAGMDDVGIGALFGLYDWRFETLALIAHAQYLDKEFNVGPHTISVPRFRGAPAVNFNPAYLVSDDEFLKIIALLRIAVPYTGLILSTRESPQIRKSAFKIGISQASAASCASTGGYGKNHHSQPQFNVQDERKLEEVLLDIVKDGFLPSFCTACYRLNRTGETFMGLSKPGEIHNFCRSNGILTFAEYLEDFSTNGIYEKGYALIRHYLAMIEDEQLRRQTEARIKKIKEGERDLYF